MHIIIRCLRAHSRWYIQLIDVIDHQITSLSSRSYTSSTNVRAAFAVQLNERNSPTISSINKHGVDRVSADVPNYVDTNDTSETIFIIQLAVGFSFTRYAFSNFTKRKPQKNAIKLIPSIFNFIQNISQYMCMSFSIIPHFHMILSNEFLCSIPYFI